MGEFKTMKISFTILALCMIGYSIAAYGTPPKASLCQIRSATSGTNTCVGCFNWGSGTIGARELASAKCLVKVSNPVLNCLFYNNIISSTKKYEDCVVCNNKTWLNLTEASKNISKIECSDTAVKATTCKAKVANCLQSMCVDQTSKALVGCKQCMKGYLASGTVLTGTDTSTKLGYTACAKSAIANCDLGLFNDPKKCYTCATGYVVVTAKTSCSAYTKDANCRELGSGDTECIECWYSYYFELSKCILGANIMALGGLVMFVLAFFN